MLDGEKIDVLLISEGTYPFYGGGVSTWSHMLCERVSNVNWHLYSINAGYEEKPIFELSPSVKKVIQLPLWAPDEPQDYDSYTGTFLRLSGTFSFPVKKYIHVNGQFEYFSQDLYYSNGFRFGISYFLDSKKTYTYRPRPYDKLYK